MADGFLGRWAQRKQAAREGKPLQEPAPPAVRPEPAVPEKAERGQALSDPPGALLQATPPVPPQGAALPPTEASPPPPTLDDTKALTPQSDFRRFVAPDVDPEVKNAAMKKLFADPHFNKMDGLDIYIDDYSIPDPLPQSMLRQLASAKFLNLFEEEKKENAAAPTSAAAPVPDAVAAAAPPVEPEPRTGPMTEDHEHTDLRLQQDHAAGPQGSGGGPQ